MKRRASAADRLAEEAPRYGRSLWLGAVLWHIAKGYEEVYKDPEKYGVWGHGLSDLYLEGLIIDGDGAELLVGS